ncbi:hypothetical protein ABZS66_34960 [Dactylosporangium sp. NPDC005572]|uniref:hypothetical protein n=1 Tax=Dactylosporangium sp. NPDC005572 TaxID=3156889 RepID=UPI0033A8D265
MLRDAGADDHVTTPFGTDGLPARMRAALRRAPPPRQTPAVSASASTLDLAAEPEVGPARPRHIITEPGVGYRLEL